MVHGPWVACPNKLSVDLIIWRSTWNAIYIKLCLCERLRTCFIFLYILLNSLNIVIGIVVVVQIQIWRTIHQRCLLTLYIDWIKLELKQINNNLYIYHIIEIHGKFAKNHWMHSWYISVSFIVLYLMVTPNAISAKNHYLNVYENFSRIHNKIKANNVIL